ncbi:MAG: DUF3857 domain-containing protein [Flavobacteriales bacterium]|nr:DUF3857 domain-containing protein [Flavobacteriales bacterium]
MIQLKKTLSILVLLISLTSYAQDEPFYKTYDWDEKPEYTINEDDSVGIVTYKDKAVREFIYNKDGDLIEYALEHHILWLNSDQAIEDNNKIYLPYSSSTELVINKGRVITKDGKVIELDESKILTAEDDETKQKYKYFTFEGVEKGSFVEYYYVFKKYPSYKGRRMAFQTSHPKYNIEFDLYSPSNLIFEFKCYNGLDSIFKDTNDTEKAHWSLKIDTIPALDRESQASYDAQREFIVYKLDRNITTGSYDISSYGKNAENAYSFLYNNTNKSETKELNKLIKLSNVKEAKGEIAKIRAIEDYIKKTIFMVDANSPDFSEISFILKNNFADESGFLKLYARIFKLLDIKIQLVMTSDRSSIKFDKDFEANNFLTDYLFYFPGIKSFLSPTDISSRIGYPPPHLTNNYGLFVKEVTLGDFNTGIGKIKFITPVHYEKTYSNIIVDVEFDSEDITKTELTIDHASGGYYAMYTQTIMHLLDEKNKKEVIDAQVKFLSEDIEITNKTVFNDDAASFGFKPFQVKANAETDVFVEKAGNKYLFKMGELIGPQMEMYQDKKRILPVETEFTRSYHRIITFTIPDGYQINNLDDINIENDSKKDGEILFIFISSYKVEGNKVTVTADEYYTIIEISPELYEDYRTVINSAADFNKVTLILEPK